jgi:hypothetical protein
MLRRLSELEAVRGRAQRIVASEPPKPTVRAVWPCGCVATGPSFERLLLHDEACGVHLPARSQTTLVIRRPDLA